MLVTGAEAVELRLGQRAPLSLSTLECDAQVVFREVAEGSEWTDINIRRRFISLAVNNVAKAPSICYDRQTYITFTLMTIQE